MELFVCSTKRKLSLVLTLRRLTGLTMWPTICFRYSSPTQFGRRVFLPIVTYTGKQWWEDRIQELLDKATSVVVDQLHHREVSLFQESLHQVITSKSSCLLWERFQSRTNLSTRAISTIKCNTLWSKVISTKHWHTCATMVPSTRPTTTISTQLPAIDIKIDSNLCFNHL